MKISHQDSLARSATELKYAKSRQTGIRPKAPRGIGTRGAMPIEKNGLSDTMYACAVNTTGTKVSRATGGHDDNAA